MWGEGGESEVKHSMEELKRFLKFYIPKKALKKGINIITIEASIFKDYGYTMRDLENAIIELDNEHFLKNISTDSELVESQVLVQFFC